jgi:predicted anti-sigma-YlaC factor YlaD
MSSHITEWLNAYLDGELKGGQLHQVKEHLAECRECRAELRALQSLSNLLHEVPAPEFTSSERFASQVNLRLPHEQLKASKKNVQEIGWWMIPVGLLATWVFINTAATVNDVVSAASRLGMLNLSGSLSWPIIGLPSGVFLSNLLGGVGLLGGRGIEWVEVTEAFTRNTLPQLTWHISIALVYLAWVVIWWARQKRQEHGQLLEG